MYVRHKFIKGHKYFYLVYGERQNGKVKQRHVRYLGKTPWGYVTPTRFARVMDKALTKVEQLPFYRRHAKKAARAAGITDARAKVQDRVHALGHVIDQTLAPQGRRKSHLGSKSKAFTAFRDELDQVANVMGNGKRQTRADRFADLVTLCLTQPRKAEKLAPQATAWLRDTLYDRPAIREGLTRAGLWELQGRREASGKTKPRRTRRAKTAKPAAPIFYRTPMTESRDKPPAAEPAAPQPVWASKGERARALVDHAIENLAVTLAAGKSEALVAYLRAMARLHSYSFRNQLRIIAQRPDATEVAGFQEWKRRGRYVKRGERGIVITAPVRNPKKPQPADESEHGVGPNPTDTDDDPIGFRTVHVFDIAQTDGAPLPTKPFQAQGDPGAYTEKLKAAMEARGITVEYRAHLAALGQSAGGKVTIRQGLSPVEEFSTLAHEFAHELIHHQPVRRAPKTVRETEAEAVAHVVGTAVGLDTTGATADYIQLYRGDSKTLYASLKTIQQTARAILRSLEIDG